MDWQNASNIATVATAIAAVVGFAFAIWQTQTFRRHQLETLARDHYQAFLQLCVEYPEYATPRTEALNMTALTFDGDRRRFDQYEWFLTAGANAMEAIYTNVGSNDAWQKTVLSILGDHMDYLRSDRYRKLIRPTADPGFVKFIEAGLNLKQ